MEHSNTNTTTTILDYLFPMDSCIKYVETAKGVRYYKGSAACGRFFPLSKAKFAALDLEQFEVYQEIAPGQFLKINGGV